MNASQVARSGLKSVSPVRLPCLERIRLCLTALAGLMSLGAPTALASSELAQVSAPTGPARRWSAGLPVGPYSEVHMETGRLWTAVPIVGWSGRGPAISFALYHHMISPFGRPLDYPNQFELLMGDANFDGQVDEADIDPFAEIMMELNPSEMELAVSDFDGSAEVDAADMESFAGGMAMMSQGLPLWTHTYDTSIYVQTNKRTVIWGDGTKDAYLWHAPSQTWKPPAGVFDTLVEEGSPVTGYMLTTKRQVKVHFLADGKLDYIEDPSGNRVTCTYIDDQQDPANGKLDYVTDAAGRTLDLDYNIHGKLSLIIAPLGTPGNPATRTWTLLYQDITSPTGEPTIIGEGALKAIDDPLDHRIAVTYNTGLDIETITDKNGSTWEFEYAGNGRLSRATDPLTHVEQYVQYAVYGGFVEGQYTDVRGKLWKIRHTAGSANLASVTNPLNQTEYLAYLDSRPQLSHEATSRTNALFKTWFFSYDDKGNVLTTADPLNNVTTYTYDTLNNLLSITPPGEGGMGNEAKEVQIVYGSTDHPTSPTSVVEPADGQGNPAATTVIGYYGDNENTGFDPDSWNGEIKSVTDANGVQTLYEYDSWGQVWRLSEGDPLQPLANRVVEAVYPGITGHIMREMRRYTGPYPAGGGEGHPLYCIFGICLEFDLNCWLLEVCCCCALLCGGSECWIPEQGCSGGEQSSAPSGAGAAGASGGGGSSFACTAFQLLGDTEGPSSFDYEPRGLLTEANTEFNDTSILPNATFNVHLTQAYDDLGALTTSVQSTNEPTRGTPLWPNPIVRAFGYTYDYLNGVYNRTGPDVQITLVESDDARRVSHVSRVGMMVDYAYYPTGEVQTATNGNGSRTTYLYDDARRLTEIRHDWVASGLLILKLEYDFSPDGLIETITESDANGWAATVTFAYDNRNRLIEEQRTGLHAYHLSYAYDQLGNRLMKTDHAAGLTTVYHYDVEDPGTYGSRNNRLMYYEVFDGANLVERVDYQYGPDLVQAGLNGNPTFIVRKKASENFYRGTTLQYHKNGTLWFVTEQTWPEDDEFCQSMQLTTITELRGEGRGRYLIRWRDPQQPDQILPGTTRWSDYDGDVIHGDFLVDEATGGVSNVMARLPGIAEMDPQTGEITYFHSDHIGSLRAATDDNGQFVGAKVYSAFGEEIHEEGTVPTRYQYAGDWGYETFSGAPFLHVGFRYYDPALGRFVQRDPIGIDGGLNVQEYVLSNPTALVDPDGHSWGPGGIWLGVAAQTPTGRAEIFLIATGGSGHVPVLDPGLAQDVVQTTADVVSIAAPCGAGALRGAALLSKFQRLRCINHNRYFRIGPGKWPSTQGRIPTIRIGTGSQWWSHWRLTFLDY